MAEIPRLLDQLRRAFDGEPWCGPSLLANLAGLSGPQAAQHPIGGAHSIWEIVAHVAGWTAVVRQRLADHRPLPAGSAEDWPAQPPHPTEATWQAALAELRTAHAALLAYAATLPEAALDRSVGATFEPPQGPGYNTYEMLHGVAQHYLYHAGQVALLRKGLA